MTRIIYTTTNITFVALALIFSNDKDTIQWSNSFKVNGIGSQGQRRKDTVTTHSDSVAIPKVLTFKTVEISFKKLFSFMKALLILSYKSALWSWAKSLGYF